MLQLGPNFRAVSFWISIMSRQRLDGGDPLSSGLFDDLPQPEASAAPVATPAESLATLDASKLNLRGGGSRGAQPPVAQPASKPSSAFADVDTRLGIGVDFTSLPTSTKAKAARADLFDLTSSSATPPADDQLAPFTVDAAAPRAAPRPPPPPTQASTLPPPPDARGFAAARSMLRRDDDDDDRATESESLADLKSAAKWLEREGATLDPLFAGATTSTSAAPAEVPSTSAAPAEVLSRRADTLATVRGLLDDEDEDVLKRLDAANLDDTAPARPAIAPTPPADDTDDLFSMLERPNGDAVADPSSFDFDSYIKNNK